MNFSQKLSKKVSDVYHQYYPFLLPASSRKVECPFCGWQGPSFLPNGIDVRQNARCPKCDSLERHRLYYLYLKNVIPADRRVKVLHFAPEKILTRLFQSFRNVDYLSADLDPTKAMVKQDITAITYPEASFDIIFCSHVLEHIPDDLLALRELRRVLKPNGFAILQVPVKDIFNGRVIDKTYEDFTITDPRERENAFGQHDHVRVYGRDFKDRIEKAGFNVRIDKFAESLDPALIKRYALLPQGTSATDTEGWIYYCN
jgi:SAM-dependent methyltransferase